MVRRKGIREEEEESERKKNRRENRRENQRGRRKESKRKKKKSLGKVRKKIRGDLIFRKRRAYPSDPHRISKYFTWVPKILPHIKN